MIEYIPCVAYAAGAIGNLILRYRLLHERRGYEAGRKIIQLTDQQRFDINFNYWVYFIFITVVFLLI